MRIAGDVDIDGLLAVIVGAGGQDGRGRYRRRGGVPAVWRAFAGTTVVVPSSSRGGATMDDGSERCVNGDMAACVQVAVEMRHEWAEDEIRSGWPWTRVVSGREAMSFQAVFDYACVRGDEVACTARWPLATRIGGTPLRLPGGLTVEADRDGLSWETATGRRTVPFDERFAPTRGERDIVVANGEGIRIGPAVEDTQLAVLDIGPSGARVRVLEPPQHSRWFDAYLVPGDPRVVGLVIPCPSRPTVVGACPVVGTPGGGRAVPLDALTDAIGGEVGRVAMNGGVVAAVGRGRAAWGRLEGALAVDVQVADVQGVRDDAVAVGPDGAVAFASDDGLFVAPAGGAPRRVRPGENAYPTSFDPVSGGTWVLADGLVSPEGYLLARAPAVSPGDVPPWLDALTGLPPIPAPRGRSTFEVVALDRPSWSDGAPISGAKMALRPASGGGRAREATADADGRVAFADVPAGAWSLEVAIPDGPAVSIDVRTPAGRPEEVWLAPCRVVVEGVGAEPDLVGAQARYVGGHFRTPPVVRDGAVATWTYAGSHDWLEVTLPDGQIGSTVMSGCFDGTLAVGVGHDRVDRVVVRDATGLPVPGARVTVGLEVGDPGQESFVTGPDGMASLPALAAWSLSLLMVDGVVYAAEDLVVDGSALVVSRALEHPTTRPEDFGTAIPSDEPAGMRFTNKPRVAWFLGSRAWTSPLQEGVPFGWVETPSRLITVLDGSGRPRRGESVALFVDDQRYGRVRLDPAGRVVVPIAMDVTAIGQDSLFESGWSVLVPPGDGPATVTMADGESASPRPPWSGPVPATRFEGTWVEPKPPADAVAVTMTIAHGDAWEVRFGDRRSLAAEQAADLLRARFVPDTEGTWQWILVTDDELLGVDPAMNLHVFERAR